MCIVHPDIREQFNLRPLGGLLLYSYKPGMGKTKLVSAIAAWLRELGNELEFDVALYLVKPNELKIVWHGGDARLVRDELCGAIRARQAVPRERPLLQLVVLDEVESLGKRVGGDDTQGITSGAQNDAVQALLAEMDGMMKPAKTDDPPAHVLWVGMSNRPDMLDEALKRPGRFGDLVLEMPGADKDGAVGILSIYAKNLTWEVDGVVRDDLEETEIRRRFLYPAMESIFDEVVLRYSADRQQSVPVTASAVLASVHYMEAMNVASKRAGRRRMYAEGVPAVTLDDVVEGLKQQALSAARQMDADRQMLRRQLRLNVAITRVEVVAADELCENQYVRGA